MTRREGNWRGWFGVLPAVFVALLPRFVCPCQLPAYASFLGAMGLAFLLKAEYQLPLTTMCLTFALSGLFVDAKRRHGYTPFGCGLLATVLLLCGKYVFASPATAYIGIGLLIGSSVWNTWPSRPRSKFRFTPDGDLETDAASEH